MRDARSWIGSGFLVTTLGIAALAPRGARAQPQTPCSATGFSRLPPGCEPIEVVVVGTRTPESAQRSTIRTGVVTREEAEARGARNVGEALAGETTLQVNPEAYGYLGRPSGVQIQGLDADRVLILEDGERVTGDVGGVVDLSELPLTDVERVEYVMGPTSALYGSNALGGVVNIVTAPPQTEGPSARGRLEARSRGELLGAASLAYRRDDRWAAVDVSAEYTPGVGVGTGRPDLLVPERKTRLIGARGGARIGRRVELRLKARWAHDDLLARSSELVPGLGVYVVNLPEVTDRLVLRAQETVHLTERARLDLSLGRSWFSGKTGRDRENSPIDEVRERKLESQSLEGSLTLSDAQTRTWVFGVRSETERFSQDLRRTEIEGVELRVRRSPEVEPTQLASGALFAQLAWRLLPTITAMPGARAELHGRYGAIVAPRLGLAFQPTESLVVRGAFGRGFRAPSAKEYGFVFDHSAIGYRVLGSTQLKPERSWGVNWDASWRPDRWLLMRGGGFANWVNELISTDLAAAQPNPNVTDYTYTNVAHARTAGGDAFLRVRPSDAFSTELGYAYLWTRDSSTGDELPNRPPHTLTAAVRGTLFGRAVGMARYRWVSSAFVADGAQAPSFGMLDLRLGCRVWRGVEAYLGALNVFDAKKDPAREGDARPALGRSFYFGVRGEVPGHEEVDHASAN